MTENSRKTEIILDPINGFFPVSTKKIRIGFYGDSYEPKPNIEIRDESKSLHDYIDDEMYEDILDKFVWSIVISKRGEKAFTRPITHNDKHHAEIDKSTKPNTLIVKATNDPSTRIYVLKFNNGTSVPSKYEFVHQFVIKSNNRIYDGTEGSLSNIVRILNGVNDGRLITLIGSFVTKSDVKENIRKLFIEDKMQQKTHNMLEFFYDTIVSGLTKDEGEKDDFEKTMNERIGGFANGKKVPIDLNLVKNDIEKLIKDVESKSKSESKDINVISSSQPPPPTLEETVEIILKKVDGRVESEYKTQAVIFFLKLLHQDGFLEYLWDLFEDSFYENLVSAFCRGSRNVFSENLNSIMAPSKKSTNVSIYETVFGIKEIYLGTEQAYLNQELLEDPIQSNWIHIINASRDIYTTIYNENTNVPLLKGIRKLEVDLPTTVYPNYILTFDDTSETSDSYNPILQDLFDKYENQMFWVYEKNGIVIPYGDIQDNLDSFVSTYHLKVKNDGIYDLWLASDFHFSPEFPKSILYSKILIARVEIKQGFDTSASSNRFTLVVVDHKDGSVKGKIATKQIQCDPNERLVSNDNQNNITIMKEKTLFTTNTILTKELIDMSDSNRSDCIFDISLNKLIQKVDSSLSEFEKFIYGLSGFDVNDESNDLRAKLPDQIKDEDDLKNMKHKDVLMFFVNKLLSKFGVDIDDHSESVRVPSFKGLQPFIQDVLLRKNNIDISDSEMFQIYIYLITLIVFENELQFKEETNIQYNQGSSNNVIKRKKLKKMKMLLTCKLLLCILPFSNNNESNDDKSLSLSDRLKYISDFLGEIVPIKDYEGYNNSDKIKKTVETYPNIKKALYEYDTFYNLIIDLVEKEPRSDLKEAELEKNQTIELDTEDDEDYADDEEQKKYEAIKAYEEFILLKNLHSGFDVSNRKLISTLHRIFNSNYGTQHFYLAPLFNDITVSQTSRVTDLTQLIVMNHELIVNMLVDTINNRLIKREDWIEFFPKLIDNDDMIGYKNLFPLVLKYRTENIFKNTEEDRYDIFKCLKDDMNRLRSIKNSNQSTAPTFKSGEGLEKSATSKIENMQLTPHHELVRDQRKLTVYSPILKSGSSNEKSEEDYFLSDYEKLPVKKKPRNVKYFRNSSYDSPTKFKRIPQKGENPYNNGDPASQKPNGSRGENEETSENEKEKLKEQKKIEEEKQRRLEETEKQRRIEAEKRLEEQKKLEEKKRLEDERKRLEEEEKRKVTEEKQKLEQKKIEEERIQKEKQKDSTTTTTTTTTTESIGSLYENDYFKSTLIELMEKGIYKSPSEKPIKEFTHDDFLNTEVDLKKHSNIYALEYRKFLFSEKIISSITKTNVRDKNVRSPQKTPQRGKKKAASPSENVLKELTKYSTAKNRELFIHKRLHILKTHLSQYYLEYLEKITFYFDKIYEEIRNLDEQIEISSKKPQANTDQSIINKKTQLNTNIKTISELSILATYPILDEYRWLFIFYKFFENFSLVEDTKRVWFILKFIPNYKKTIGALLLLYRGLNFKSRIKISKVNNTKEITFEGFGLLYNDNVFNNYYGITRKAQSEESKKSDKYDYDTKEKIQLARLFLLNDALKSITFRDEQEVIKKGKGITKDTEDKEKEKEKDKVTQYDWKFFPIILCKIFLHQINWFFLQKYLGKLDPYNSVTVGDSYSYPFDFKSWDEMKLKIPDEKALRLSDKILFKYSPITIRGLYKLQGEKYAKVNLTDESTLNLMIKNLYEETYDKEKMNMNIITSLFNEINDGNSNPIINLDDPLKIVKETNLKLTAKDQKTRSNNIEYSKEREIYVLSSIVTDNDIESLIPILPNHKLFDDDEKEDDEKKAIEKMNLFNNIKNFIKEITKSKSDVDYNLPRVLYDSNDDRSLKFGEYNVEIRILKNKDQDKEFVASPKKVKDESQQQQGGIVGMLKRGASYVASFVPGAEKDSPTSIYITVNNGISQNLWNLLCGNKSDLKLPDFPSQEEKINELIGPKIPDSLSKSKRLLHDLNNTLVNTGTSTVSEDDFYITLMLLNKLDPLWIFKQNFIKPEPRIVPWEIRVLHRDLHSGELYDVNNNNVGDVWWTIKNDMFDGLGDIRSKIGVTVDRERDMETVYDTILEVIHDESGCRNDIPFLYVLMYIKQGKSNIKSLLDSQMRIINDMIEEIMILRDMMGDPLQDMTNNLYKYVDRSRLESEDFILELIEWFSVVDDRCEKVRAVLRDFLEKKIYQSKEQVPKSMTCMELCVLFFDSIKGILREGITSVPINVKNTVMSMFRRALEDNPHYKLLYLLFCYKSKDHQGSEDYKNTLKNKDTAKGFDIIKCIKMYGMGTFDGSRYKYVLDDVPKSHENWLADVIVEELDDNDNDFSFRRINEYSDTVHFYITDKKSMLYRLTKWQRYIYSAPIDALIQRDFTRRQLPTLVEMLKSKPIEKTRVKQIYIEKKLLNSSPNFSIKGIYLAKRSHIYDYKKDIVEFDPLYGLNTLIKNYIFDDENPDRTGESESYTNEKQFEMFKTLYYDPIKDSMIQDKTLYIDLINV